METLTQYELLDVLTEEATRYDTTGVNGTPGSSATGGKAGDLWDLGSSRSRIGLGDETLAEDHGRCQSPIELLVIPGSNRTDTRYLVGTPDESRLPALHDTGVFEGECQRPKSASLADVLGVTTDQVEQTAVSGAEFWFETPACVALQEPENAERFMDCSQSPGLWVSEIVDALSGSDQNIVVQILLFPTVDLDDGQAFDEVIFPNRKRQFAVTVRAIEYAPDADTTSTFESIQQALTAPNDAIEGTPTVTHRSTSDALDVEGVCRRFADRCVTIGNEAHQPTTEHAATWDDKPTTFATLPVVNQLLRLSDDDHRGRTPQLDNPEQAWPRVDSSATHHHGYRDGALIGHRGTDSGVVGQPIRLPESITDDHLWIDAPAPSQRSDIGVPHVLNRIETGRANQFVVDPEGTFTERYLDAHRQRYGDTNGVNHVDIAESVPVVSSLPSILKMSDEKFASEAVSTLSRVIARVGIDLAGPDTIDNPNAVHAAIQRRGHVMVDHQATTVDIDLDILDPDEPHQHGLQTDQAVTDDLRRVHNALTTNPVVREFIESTDTSQPDSLSVDPTQAPERVTLIDLGDVDPTTTFALTHLLLAEARLGIEYGYRTATAQSIATDYPGADLTVTTAHRFLDAKKLERLATRRDLDVSLTFLLDGDELGWVAPKTRTGDLVPAPYPTPGAVVTALCRPGAPEANTFEHRETTRWRALLPSPGQQGQAKHLELEAPAATFGHLSESRLEGVDPSVSPMSR